MEKKDIEQLKELCFRQKEYKLEEVKKYLRQMADSKAVNSIFKVAHMKGYKKKKVIPAADVFKLVYILLEMTHDPNLQTDAEAVNCKITQLEEEYL
jgi:hypothetical protein